MKNVNADKIHRIDVNFNLKKKFENFIIYILNYKFLKYIIFQFNNLRNIINYS